MKEDTHPGSATTGVARGFDPLTVKAIAALAYVLSTALHEHGGHAAAGAALGGHVKAFGAFYVDCDDRTMGGAGMRLDAIAVLW